MSRIHLALATIIIIAMIYQCNGKPLGSLFLSKIYPPSDNSLQIWPLTNILNGIIHQTVLAQRAQQSQQAQTNLYGAPMRNLYGGNYPTAAFYRFNNKPVYNTGDKICRQ